jgi:hypothetical protein
MKFLKMLGGLLLAGTLMSCGGGGGSPGDTGSGTGGDGGSTPPVTANSFIFTLSKNQLNNSGSDTVDLEVTALDANNNPVVGASATVSVTSGVYTPDAVVTDNNGRAGGTITIGADKSNRNITATINVGGKTATAVIPVIGSAITLTAVPATPAPGQTVRVDIKVNDFNGTGVANVPVALSGTLGLSGTVTTDATGTAVANLGAAPATGGSYTVDASALGVSATRLVQVVTGGGGGIPAAVGVISSASLSIVPNTIAPNVNGGTTNKAALRARFLDAGNTAIQNVRVRFEIEAPALGSGEAITSGTGIVYSDNNGEAIADYVAGSRSSPTNGVKIRACYAATDAALAGGACPSFQRATLTVASQPLSITLGDNNLLEAGNNSLTYIKKFDVAVADSAGNAVANASVSASVDITHYGKGAFLGPYPVVPPTAATPINNTADPGGARGWCRNEDTNRNGSLDAGEDINNNGTIQPRKADVILSFVGGNTTGANGRMTIQVEYPQNVATWLAYTVRVTTNVAGSEGTDAKTYVTTFIDGDEDNGSFLIAPYGENACNAAD